MEERQNFKAISWMVLICASNAIATLLATSLPLLAPIWVLILIELTCISLDIGMTWLRMYSATRSSFGEVQEEMANTGWEGMIMGATVLFVALAGIVVGVFIAL